MVSHCVGASLPPTSQGAHWMFCRTPSHIYGGRWMFCRTPSHMPGAHWMFCRTPSHIPRRPLNVLPHSLPHLRRPLNVLPNSLPHPRRPLNVLPHSLPHPTAPTEWFAALPPTSHDTHCMFWGKSLRQFSSSQHAFVTHQQQPLSYWKLNGKNLQLMIHRSMMRSVVKLLLCNSQKQLINMRIFQSCIILNNFNAFYLFKIVKNC